MEIKRQISDYIQGLTRHYPVVILTGARQTGKTTLLKSIFSDYQYVSLDLPSIAEQAETNPQRFLQQHGRPLIIDEIQYAPGIFRHIKQTVDEQRHQMGQFILTGSQKFPLMKEVSDSLAGRCVWLELETCSWSELAAAALVSTEKLSDVILRGQYPELWRQPGMSSDDFYRSYLATYLERDVRQILRVTSLRDFERFIRILAARSSSLLNKSEVARDVGVSVKAIGDWLSVLEASNIVFLLEPFYSNLGKRIVKSPKVYFNDSGLLAFLLGVNAGNFAASPFLGPLWETFVFSEMRKTNSSQSTRKSLWYYRDQSATEVDFVIESGGILSLLEVKWSEQPDQRVISTLQKVSSQVEKSKQFTAGQHYCLCRAQASYERDGVLITNLEDLDSILLTQV